MNHNQNTKHKVGYEKMKNTEPAPRPKHIKMGDRFLGENLGVNGRMKKVSSKNTT